MNDISLIILSQLLMGVGYYLRIFTKPNYYRLDEIFFYSGLTIYTTQIIKLLIEK